MPYTTLENRRKFEPSLNDLRNSMDPNNLGKGDMTYLVYCIGLEYIKKRGGDSYTNISTAISCLNDAAEELRRKKLNPYEDDKIIENGDVE